LSFNYKKWDADGHGNIRKTALAYINGELPDVYSENYNFIGAGIESAVKGYSFDLVNADTVRELAAVDKPFRSELGDIMYPGDPAAHPANVYNCRCTLGSKIIGFIKQNGSGEVLISETESDIIGSAGRLVLSTYVNSSDMLYKYSKKIEPIEGYEDIVIHGDESGFELRDLNDDVASKYTPREFAEMLREDPNYHGGDIRLISCQSGKGDTSAAQMLSNQLGVNVLAPNDVVFVDINGNISIGEENDGEWILFKPKRGTK